MLQLPNFKAGRLLVVGDVMLDRYWYGDTGRISPEAPVPVVHIQQQEDRLGGAANVARNIASMGGQVAVLGVCGTDEAATHLKKLLNESAIYPLLIPQSSVPTITKLRVIGRNQQLIRVDFEQPLPPVKNAIEELYKKHLNDADVVILSDYNKGVLSSPEALIQAAKAAGKTVLVDPKQLDFTVYRGADLVTPNRSEFEKAVGRCQSDSDFEIKGFALIAETGIRNLLITRGSQGMTLLLGETKTVYHIPARAREVYDITGAGDTVIGILGLCLACGESFESSAKYANVAAGCVVAKLGTAALTVDELHFALANETASSMQSVLTENQAFEKVALAKSQNKRVVLTNGCFDILHPGHIQYLEEAKALGHYLIVAVNDDASVKRLKGADRPIHNLEHRMRILASLGCVDWVVPFSEDTPERLINKLLPNVLVKGGDYKVEEVAGHKSVLQSGGEVKILSFVDGYSTTKSIEKMAGMKESAVEEIS